MRLLRLLLRNHRNYAQLELNPGPGLNLFLGRNGQGKTNLLEAVAILALSSSPRARRDSDLVGPLFPESRIEAVVEVDGRTVQVRIDHRVEEGRARRRIEVDGVARRAFDLPGLVRVSLFWPDDLELVKLGPEHRRRLLNQLLVQVERGYARTLSRYGRAVEQRNALLRRIQEGLEGTDSLDAWDAEVVRLGTELVSARSLAVAELAPVAAERQLEISGERLEVAYLGPEGDLAEAVHKSRGQDIRRGVTSVGPHRDDLDIRVDGREARAFASQGQQRTAVVALKLAEAALIEARTGSAPILLLDDVLSELDAGRREALMTAVAKGGQVIVTSAESVSMSALVEAGALVRCIAAGELVACG